MFQVLKYIFHFSSHCLKGKYILPIPQMKKPVSKRPSNLLEGTEFKSQDGNSKKFTWDWLPSRTLSTVLCYCRKCGFPPCEFPNSCRQSAGITLDEKHDFDSTSFWKSHEASPYIALSAFTQPCMVGWASKRELFLFYRWRNRGSKPLSPWVRWNGSEVVSVFWPVCR